MICPPPRSNVRARLLRWVGFLTLAVGLPGLAVAVPGPTAVLGPTAEATPSSPENPYLRDLAALFEELDTHYPFFEAKGLEKEWKARKRQLAARANRCRQDEDFVPILIDTLKGLRDGHCSIEEMKAPWPKNELAWPGIALLPATKGRVVVMSTAGNLKSQLPPGTVITRIEGKPARRWLERKGQLAQRQMPLHQRIRGVAQTLQVHIDRVIEIACLGDLSGLLKERPSPRRHLVFCLRHKFLPDLYP